MPTLILTRHSQSLWNAENRFMGWGEVPLSERERAESTITSDAPIVIFLFRKT